MRKTPPKYWIYYHIKTHEVLVASYTIVGGGSGVELWQKLGYVIGSYEYAKQVAEFWMTHA